MKIVSFLHQKGGTGKSTLAVATAMALAARDESVLLLDADYQGTASEWGNRFGRRFGVETRSYVQPLIHQELKRFGKIAGWLIIDGPPSLSPMTESILRCGGSTIIPLRPSQPDLWALPWLAAIIKKMAREGAELKPLVLFNMVREEPLEQLRAEAAQWELPVNPRVIPLHPGFPAIFDGRPLPGELAELLLELQGLPPAGTEGGGNPAG